ELAHCGVAQGRIGSENFLVHDPAHTEVAHRFHYQTAGAGVGVSGNSCFESLDYSESRRVAQPGRIEDLVTALTQLVDPLGEVEVLEEAAHRGQLEMGVSIYEAGQQDRVAEVVVVPCWCAGSGANVGDFAVALDDGSVLDRRLGDWEHPARVIAHQRGIGVGGRAGPVSARGAVPGLTLSRRGTRCNDVSPGVGLRGIVSRRAEVPYTVRTRRCGGCRGRDGHGPDTALRGVGGA